MLRGKGKDYLRGIPEIYSPAKEGRAAERREREAQQPPTAPLQALRGHNTREGAPSALQNNNFPTILEVVWRGEGAEGS